MLWTLHSCRHPHWTWHACKYDSDHVILACNIVKTRWSWRPGYQISIMNYSLGSVHLHVLMVFMRAKWCLWHDTYMHIHDMYILMLFLPCSVGCSVCRAVVAMTLEARNILKEGWLTLFKNKKTGIFNSKPAVSTWSGTYTFICILGLCDFFAWMSVAW